MLVPKFTLDVDKLAELVVKAMPEQIDRATKQAISATVKSARQKIGSDVVRQHKLPSQFKRERIFSTEGDDFGSVWVGVNPVLSSVLGNIKQNRSGVRAGRHFFKGAFAATLQSGHRAAFKRKKTSTRRTRGRPRTSSPNLGIDETTVEISKIDAIMARQQVRAARRMEAIFTRELRKLQSGTVLQ